MIFLSFKLKIKEIIDCGIIFLNTLKSRKSRSLNPLYFYSALIFPWFYPAITLYRTWWWNWDSKSCCQSFPFRLLPSIYLTATWSLPFLSLSPTWSIPFSSHLTSWSLPFSSLRTSWFLPFSSLRTSWSLPFSSHSAIFRHFISITTKF